ncbi:MAG TPA: hypothetical protein VK116_10670 [Planctomycetota bacterium]|nr:hypothetical protein [Planctomycetota bacterium]
MWKWIKRSVLGVALATALGFLFFGSQLFSYVKASKRMVQESIAESVPFEYKLKQARLMLEDLVPEMHASIKEIASEQVDIASLERELEEERKSVSDERQKIAKLRDLAGESRTSYRIGYATYSRDQLLEELSRRFKHFQTAEVLVASKEKLLENRRRSLAAALEKLERMRIARVEVEAQIEALETQHRLLQNEAKASRLELDDSKLAQVEKLIGDLRRRLEVSEKVLSHEARFIEQIPIEPLDEAQLLEEIDLHLSEPKVDDTTRALDASL